MYFNTKYSHCIFFFFFFNFLFSGFLSWDTAYNGCDLNSELQLVINQTPKEEPRTGEHLIQHVTENLVTEVLINAQVNTLRQCMKNLLTSYTRHKHIIHAGYAFGGTGSWVLQDGTFSYMDLIDTLQEGDVQWLFQQYANSISIHVHCAPEGDWVSANLAKEPSTKFAQASINPADKCSMQPGASNFVAHLSKFLKPQPLGDILEPSDVVGNIRFSRPTLYVFPGGQGDSALFGVNGFNMLVDGGFSRRACFWDFVRHLDRVDALLVTRLNNSNISGVSSLLQRKAMSEVYPQIGHVFCNLSDGKKTSPDGLREKDQDSLLINIGEENQNLISNLKQLNVVPQKCYRDPNLEPVNLYHKVGHGRLDMYVVNPTKDSREVKEFLHQWNAQSQYKSKAKSQEKELTIPLPNLMSICALLVWQPADPADSITRILFPGSSPQSKIFAGLDKLKHLDVLKHSMCSENSMASVGQKKLQRMPLKTAKREASPVTKKIEIKSTISKPMVKKEEKKFVGRIEEKKEFKEIREVKKVEEKKEIKRDKIDEKKEMRKIEKIEVKKPEKLEEKKEVKKELKKDIRRFDEKKDVKKIDIRRPPLKKPEAVKTNGVTAAKPFASNKVEIKAKMIKDATVIRPVKLPQVPPPVADKVEDVSVDEQQEEKRSLDEKQSLEEEIRAEKDEIQMLEIEESKSEDTTPPTEKIEAAENEKFPTKEQVELELDQEVIRKLSLTNLVCEPFQSLKEEKIKQLEVKPETISETIPESSEQPMTASDSQQLDVAPDIVRRVSLTDLVAEPFESLKSEKLKEADDDDVTPELVRKLSLTDLIAEPFETLKNEKLKEAEEIAPIDLSVFVGTEMEQFLDPKDVEMWKSQKELAKEGSQVKPNEEIIEEKIEVVKGEEVEDKEVAPPKISTAVEAFGADIREALMKTREMMLGGSVYVPSEEVEQDNNVDKDTIKVENELENVLREKSKVEEKMLPEEKSQVVVKSDLLASASKDKTETKKIEETIKTDVAEIIEKVVPVVPEKIEKVVPVVPEKLKKLYQLYQRKLKKLYQLYQRKLKKLYQKKLKKFQLEETIEKFVPESQLKKVVPESQLEEIQKVVPEDQLEEIRKVVPESQLEEIRKVVPESQLEEIQKVVPESQLKEIQKVVPESQLEEIKKVIPESQLEEIKKVVPESQLEEIKKVVPESQLEEIKKVVPESQLEEIQKVVPESQLEKTIEEAIKVAPQSQLEKTIEEAIKVAPQSQLEQSTEKPN
uniref:Microtubule-associated protein futsch n=1 Tax=Strigamia maritima TaxID=126957 RepID=T1IZ67_STRMM